MSSYWPATKADLDRHERLRILAERRADRVDKKLEAATTRADGVDKQLNAIQKGGRTRAADVDAKLEALAQHVDAAKKRADDALGVARQAELEATAANNKANITDARMRSVASEIENAKYYLNRHLYGYSKAEKWQKLDDMVRKLVRESPHSTDNATHSKAFVRAQRELQSNLRGRRPVNNWPPLKQTIQPPVKPPQKQRLKV